MDILNADLYFEKANDAIREAKGDVFKLDLLDEYNTSFEKPWRSFKKEGHVSADMLYRHIKEAYERAYEYRRKGICLRTVHVVSLPFSEYLKLEINDYKASQTMGEKIYLIERGKFAKIAKPKGIRLMDLLIVDEAVFLVKYADVRNNIGGELIGSFLIDEPDKVEKYKEYEKRILRKALPLNRFLREHRIV